MATTHHTCSTPNCDRKVKGHGLCKLHYDRAKRAGLLGGSPCKAEGCNRIAYSNGLCTLHVQRMQKHGDLAKGRHKVNGGQCTVDGCEKTATGRGMCPMHYQRFRLHGSTDLPPRPAPKPPSPCVMDDCEAPSVGRGYCAKHYTRYRKYGDPTFVGTTAKPPKPCAIKGCEGYARTRGMCLPHYNRWKLHGDPHWTPPTEVEKFWAKVNKTGGCWLWQGSRSEEGYGRHKVSSKTVAAHRYSYAVTHGPIPEGYQIDHQCHNPSCVRPDHLRLAEPEWNSAHRKGANQGNKSGYRGVTWYRQVGKWRARVMHRGVNYELGNFDDPYEAHLAVVAKRKELHHWDAPDNHLGDGAA